MTQALFSAEFDIWVYFSDVSLAFARSQSGPGKVASNRVLIQMEKGNQAYLNLEWET